MSSKVRVVRIAAGVLASLMGWASGSWLFYLILRLLGHETDGDIYLGSLPAGIAGVVLVHVLLWRSRRLALATASPVGEQVGGESSLAPKRPPWGRAISLGAIPVVVAAGVAFFWVGWVADRGSEVDPNRLVFESDRTASVTFGVGETAAVYVRDRPAQFFDMGGGGLSNVAASTVACRAKPDGLTVMQTDRPFSAAIDRTNRWKRVARLAAEGPGSYTISCTVTGYLEDYVLTLAIADEDPGNNFSRACLETSICSVSLSFCLVYRRQVSSSCSGVKSFGMARTIGFGYVKSGA